MTDSNTLISWIADPAQIGAIYPLSGLEVVLCVVAAVYVVYWIVWQNRDESKQYRDIQKTHNPHVLLKKLQERAARDKEG